MRRSAFRLVSSPGAVGALLLMAHPRRRCMIRPSHLFLITVLLLLGCESLFSQSVTNSPYAQVLSRIYLRGWRPPDRATNIGKIPEASVVIARDGRVMSAKLIKPSGDEELDSSVQQALKRVTAVFPFPKSLKGESRAFTIRFDRSASPRDRMYERHA